MLGKSDATGSGDVPVKVLGANTSAWAQEGSWWGGEEAEESGTQ
jgi:hypothetical protein